MHEAVLINIRKIIRAVDLYSRKLAQHYQLTGPQLAILREIEKHDGLSIGGIAQSIHLSNATVTGILDRLEKRGLILRIRSSRDRRQINVMLTPDARETLENAPPLLQDHFVKIFDGMSRREQKQILTALEKVAEIMGAEKIDAAPMLLSHPPELSDTDILK
ncbi:MarR family transcriptional regulator [bacterium]|nr:MarR family transcriptional regulator [candidate division CSSED10-310 bacterium]